MCKKILKFCKNGRATGQSKFLYFDQKYVGVFDILKLLWKSAKQQMRKKSKPSFLPNLSFVKSIFEFKSEKWLQYSQNWRKYDKKGFFSGQLAMFKTGWARNTFWYCESMNFSGVRKASLYLSTEFFRWESLSYFWFFPFGNQRTHKIDTSHLSLQAHLFTWYVLLYNRPAKGIDTCVAGFPLCSRTKKFYGNPPIMSKNLVCSSQIFTLWVLILKFTPESNISLFKSWHFNGNYNNAMHSYSTYFKHLFFHNRILLPINL